MRTIALLVSMCLALGGCAVVSVGASAVGAAVDVAGSAAGAAVDVTGSAVGGTVDLATSSDEERTKVEDRTQDRGAPEQSLPR